MRNCPYIFMSDITIRVLYYFHIRCNSYNTCLHQVLLDLFHVYTLVHIYIPQIYTLVCFISKNYERSLSYSMESAYVINHQYIWFEYDEYFQNNIHFYPERLLHGLKAISTLLRIISKYMGIIPKTQTPY
jgi:hypothetical protein